MTVCSASAQETGKNMNNHSAIWTRIQLTYFVLQYMLQVNHDKYGSVFHSGISLTCRGNIESTEAIDDVSDSRHIETLFFVRTFIRTYVYMWSK